MTTTGYGFRPQRILVLAPRDPYPVTGGDTLRIHRIAQELARHHELTLLTLCRSQRDRDLPMPDDGVFKHVQRVVLPSWKSWLNTLGAIPSREPLQVAYYRSSAYRAAVEQLAPLHDIVLTHLVRTAAYAKNLPCSRLLEMTDAISMGMMRTAKSGGTWDPRRLIYAIEGRRMPAYEREMAKAFDIVSLTSMVDSKFLFNVAREKHDRVMILPNGVSTPAANPPPQRSRRGNEIAFVGNLRSLQNFDAVWYFATQVLPKIRARLPNATLRVIGEARPLAAWRLRRLPGVVVAGIVPHVGTALATARVGVCPTRAGAGVKNKVLDYLANGVATVASPVGVEGLNVRDGKQVLIADSPEEWADSVIRLLEDESLAQRLADAGRELTQREYRWSECMLPLLERLEQLRSAPQRSPEAEREPDVVIPLVKTGT